MSKYAVLLSGLAMHFSMFETTMDPEKKSWVSPSTSKVFFLHSCQVLNSNYSRHTFPKVCVQNA